MVILAVIMKASLRMLHLTVSKRSGVTRPLSLYVSSLSPVDLLSSPASFLLPRFLERKQTL